MVVVEMLEPKMDKIMKSSNQGNHHKLVAVEFKREKVHLLKGMMKEESDNTRGDQEVVVNVGNRNKKVMVNKIDLIQNKINNSNREA